MAQALSAPSNSNRESWTRRWFNTEALTAWVFILPSLVGFVTFYAVPAVRGLYFSFTDWDMLKDPNFIGFDNYVAIFQDKQFWQSLSVTVYYVLLNIPAQTVLAVLLAVMMDRVVKSTLVRSVFILPWQRLHPALASAGRDRGRDLGLGLEPRPRPDRLDLPLVEPDAAGLPGLAGSGDAVGRDDQHLAIHGKRGPAHLRRPADRPKGGL